MTIQCIRAGRDDLDRIASLFDAYRVFYGRRSDPPSAHTFIAERFRGEDSVITLAVDETGSAVGFAQAYPFLSSVAMRPIWVLNDLYVREACRGQGIGRALLDDMVARGRAAGVARLELATEADNAVAQRLYESCGWQRSLFVQYIFGLDDDKE